MYEEIKGMHDWFDFSNYDVNHTNFDRTNKLQPGYFKDEMGGKPPMEFIRLLSKMYTIKTKEKTLKGMFKL